MKICRICVQNDMLCQACNEKLKNGIITETDVAVSRAIFKVVPVASFIRSIGNGMVLILADRANSVKLIGRNGKNAKLIEKELGKKIRIIEKTGEKEMIENIFSLPIIGINILYSGEQKHLIRVQRQFQRRFHHDSVGAVSSLLGKKFEVIFE